MRAPSDGAIIRADRAERHQSLNLPAAVAATFLWSAGNVLVRAASIPGPQLAFWRTLCGAIIYHAVWRSSGGRMRWSTLRIAALGGLGFGLQASLYFAALKMTTVTTAAVIAALQPIMLVPMLRRLYGERMDGRRLVLVAIAIGGAVLVVTGASSTGHWSARGDLLALLATLAGCLYFIGTKSARATLDTLEYQAAALTVAAAATLPAALLIGGGLVLPSGSQIAWPIVMTLVPGSGHLLMTWSQRRLSVATTSTLALAVAPLTAIASTVFFHEVLGLQQLLGVAVVVGALMFFIRSSSAV